MPAVFECGLPAAGVLCGLSTGSGLGAGGSGWLFGRERCGPAWGWSGRLGGRPAGRFPQVEPFGLAVPALGEVEREAAPAVAGGAGGDRGLTGGSRLRAPYCESACEPGESELLRLPDSEVEPGSGRAGQDGIAVRELRVHRIEEYARHCGHADLLRECIDGRVGNCTPP